MRNFMVTNKKTGQVTEISDVEALAKHLKISETSIPNFRLFKVTYGDDVVFERLNAKAHQPQP